MNYNPNLEIQSTELHKLLLSSRPPRLFDIQKPELFQEWSILDSENISLDQIREIEKLSGISRDEALITICGSGNKSKTAAKILQDLGYNALSLFGGITAWNNVFDAVDFAIQQSDLKVTQIRRIAKGCLSYMVSFNNETAVIDPAHNFKFYLDVANDQNLEIKHVIDTHLHADHVSGARELAQATGAKLYLSVNDPHGFEFTPLETNEIISLGGKPIIRAISTPGHTRGSYSFRIKDLGIMTGDILFVDGIGRPDLANKAIEFADDLYQTLSRKIVTLPQNMFVAPGHHGKFVQKHFHHPITTTIGEKIQDKALKMNEDEFIDFAVSAANSTSRPPSYETIIRINKGDLSLSKEEILKIEAGPNRCAI